MAQKREANQQKGGVPAQKNSELNSSEQRYHKMIDEVLDYAIILLDQDGIIQNWNRGAEKIKQYTEEEAVGRHFSMFYLPGDRSSGLPGQLLNQAVREGRAVHEGWRLRKDGSRFWGSISLTALHGEDGEIIGFSKVTRDLTERKTAEDQLKQYADELEKKNEALRISEEHYHKMVSEVQDYAIILLDVHGNVQNWNAGAEKIKGYNAEEIIGKNFATFYTPEDRQRNLPQQLLNEARLQGKAVHEGWRVTKNGSTFWGSIVITALHAEDGSVIGFSKVTRDLTEKKEAEDQLRQYLFELEKQNAELDQFAYAASHDLQEPLRKIVTFADLIEQNIGDEETVRKYAEKITASSQRMSMLIRAVLDYSQLAKGAPLKTPTDLNRVLSEVLMDFELLVQQKDADIEYGPLPVIQAIPLQINQLFSNLIGNALKFTNQRPLIRISSTVVEKWQLRRSPANLPDGKYLQLLFADNGIGFDPQYEQMIFSLFQRLHNRHEYSGTGIGLALCKKVMDNHGGWIAAEGNPGKGASFYLYFPMDWLAQSA
jgi:PAS domain S-box-containing protein